jgi:primary-amine oxidase
MHKFSVLVLALFFAVNPVLASKHAFDDLSVEEVKRAVDIIRKSGKFDAEVRFPLLRRQDPPKKEWLSGAARDQRLAYAVVFDYKKGLLSEVQVDLGQGKMIDVKERPGSKPPLLIEEYDRAREIVRADKRWQNAMKSRGFEDFDDLFLDVWGPGLVAKEIDLPKRRLLRIMTYTKRKGKNVYSRPIEGVLVTVDLVSKSVVDFLDLGKIPVAEGIREFNREANTPNLPALKPLIIKQDSGPSFKLNGQLVEWAQWKFRFSMDPMRGAQLYHVTYRDGDQDRSVLYKMSLTEMLVPYADPDETWSFRNAFDVGEYGLGKTAHPLKKGEDVPENAVLLDAVIPSDVGAEPAIIPGAVAIFERDAGILWKHRDSESGQTDIRRARELVLMFLTTIGNYDYGISYIFHLDGSIQVEAQLTGILLPKGSSMTKNPCTSGCQSLVEKNIIAPNHQHFFNFRIDLDVDSANGNSAVEEDVVAVAKGTKSPDGNAFIATNRWIKSEKDGKRNYAPDLARKWKVVNLGKPNSLGHMSGYLLKPGETAKPYLHPSSPIRKRAKFVDHPVWFTAYGDGEESGAGNFPTSTAEGEGLPKFISDNQSLHKQDVVLWYTFGVTHVPRPEEWPIMNLQKTGFTLMPVNFFSENPAMKRAD